MQAVGLTFADGFRREGTGKSSIIGMYNNINVSLLPVAVEGLGVIARLAIYPDEFAKKYLLRFQVVDADSHAVLTHELLMTAPKSDSRGAIIMDHLVQLPKFEIPRFGSYELVLSIEGEIEMAYPFEVTMIV